MGDILVRFLVSLDAYSDETLTIELRNAFQGADGKREIDGLEAGGRPLGNEERYLCAKFVHYLYREHPLLIDRLVRIVQVGLLVEVIEEFRKPTHERTDSNLTVFLDAPLALSILDVSGARNREEVDMIVKALKSIGCRIQILSESIEEIKGVLRGVLNSQKHDRYGPTHAAIIKREVSEEYVRTVLNDPEGALQHYEINVKYMSVDQYQNSHHLFDGERITDLISRINWERMGAREHDSRCIAYTMRLRAGQHRADPLDCRYIFASSNAKLARIAREYCVNERLIADTQFGPVITRRDLAALAWIRTGFEGSGELPMRHMLAQCEQVLGVKKEMVSKIKEHIKEYSPDREKQLELLLMNNRAVTKMMDETLGEPERIEDVDANKMLDVMLAATADEVKAEYEDRLKEERKKARDRQAALKSEHVAVVGKQNETIQELSAEQERLRAELSRKLERERSILVGAATRANSTYSGSYPAASK